MNQVALIGNITDDPELRCTQSGAALANFTVAVGHRSKHNGEWLDVNDGLRSPSLGPFGHASSGEGSGFARKERQVGQPQEVL